MPYRADLHAISAALFGHPSIDGAARALEIDPRRFRRIIADNQGILPRSLRAELLQLMIERRNRLNELIDQESRAP